MKRIFSRLAFYMMMTAGVLSCTGANLYKDLASNKSSDEALYEDAMKLLDGGDYSGAIDAILETTADFRAQTRVKEGLAGAYAARCGMVFLTFISSLTGSGGESFYKMALNGFVGIDTSNFADCVTARDIVKGIGTSLQRTSSQNLFLAVLGMAIIGNRLRANADKLPTAVGDGVVDAAYNCGPTQMPIADAASVIEGFALIMENITALGTIASGVATDLQGIADTCGGDCTTITYAGASPAESDDAIIASRTLLNMQSIGLGSCSVDPCVCLDP
ncbi:MAG: hypothetical protein IPM97_13500 [Bdellovibrionaceae bacterium]|nr:hypothetical protein [Pseudobdellovibrionaceae bacterium]